MMMNVRHQVDPLVCIMGPVLTLRVPISVTAWKVGRITIVRMVSRICQNCYINDTGKITVNNSRCSQLFFFFRYK